MSTITTLIAEDEPLAAESLAGWVRDSSGLELVGMCADGETALERIRALNPQLVLMDINMPGVTGLDVVRRLRAEGLDTTVIFTTAYDEHALVAFELHAVDYLLKPFSRERFDEAVEHALQRSGTPAPIEELDERAQVEPLVRIFVRERGAIVPVPVNSIEHFQSDHKYTSIYSNGKTYLVRVPLSGFEERLDPGRFLKLQRGCIVNLEFVESMTPTDTSQLVVKTRSGANFTASREVSKKLREQSL